MRSSSFPSGHTASAFALSYHYPLHIIPVMVLATIVAYTRIHTGVHHPSDVIAGGLTGAGIGSLVTLLAERAARGSITKTHPARPRLPALWGDSRRHREWRSHG